jgi:subtilisin family serine protease
MARSRLSVVVPALCAAFVATLAVGASAQAGMQQTPRGGNVRDIAIADPATRFVPGEVLVRFRAGVSAAARNAALGAQNATLVRESLVSGLVLARLNRGQTVLEAVQAFERRSDVLYAEPNLIFRATATPNDPRFADGELWGLHNIGQNGGVVDADIDAPDAWNTTTGSNSVVVAVVDTGVAYDHPDLSPNIWANPGEVPGDSIDNDGNGKVDDHRGWDFISNDNNPRDFNAHGTHVAGTIGAKGNNATGVVGVNWNVKLMPVRVLDTQGSGTTFTVTDGFVYAAQEGAKVVNASLGIEGGPEPLSIKAAIDGAPATLFVVAAGNGGLDGIGDNNDSGTAHWPCNHTSANLVCVASTTRTDARSGFSNFGATSVDLGAPGSAIVSTWLAFDSKFADGFESATGWVAGGTPNTWARTTETAATGTFSATDSPGGPYAASTENWFRIPAPVSFTGGFGCNVAYGLNLATTSPDYMFIDASTNGGASWFEIAGWTGSTVGNWIDFGDDLSQFDNAPSLHLRWGVFSPSAPVADGAHIDDVDIRCVGTTYTPSSYESIQGTSMATPHVAGVAALAWAKNSSVSVATVKSALLNGGDANAALSGITVSGRRLNANGTLGLIPASGTPELTVLKGGNGGGTVTGTGINCGTDCTESYASGTPVVLTATPLYASTLTSWSNCDSPSGDTCTMTMSTSKTVSANFSTTPTFVDVPPTNPHYPDIEHLFDLGITQGCSQSNGQLFFCPTQNVPREQMAAFLVRAKGLTQLFPATPTFADVPAGTTFFGYIERLFEQGITQGCGVNGSGQPLFCPTQPVPREQMAAFLVRAKGLTQLFPATPTFADVPAGTTFFGYIERLFEQGITQGCGVNGSGQPLFCPSGLVSRQQMASFLIRAFA